MDNNDVADQEQGLSADSMASAAGSHPRWFNPLRLLCIFCVTNMVVYLDRGVIASNGVNGRPRDPVTLPDGSGIQGDFDLSKFQDGLLAAAFLVGLLIASPIFSEACKHHSAFRLIGIGMGTWCVATLACGLSTGFWTLLFARMLVGVGEASFVALASPFIDDYAPPARKASWFGAFYLCIPVGFAMGYIYGGLVAANLHWRAAFIMESAAMVPFVLFAFISAPLHLHGSKDSGPDPDRPRSWKQVVLELAHDVRKIQSHAVWLCMAAGYTLYTAVLGVYAYWGPQAGAAVFELPSEQADIAFGIVTVLTGVLGSMSGGLLLDALGSTLRNANLLCAMASLGGFIMMTTAFLFAGSFALFMTMFTLAELMMFCIQAPVGAIGMWSVPTALRPLAISLITVCIHLGGDVPSPPFVGWLQSQLERGKTLQQQHQQWRYSLAIMTSFLLFAGGAFLVAARMSVGAPDYRKVDSGTGEDSVEPRRGRSSGGTGIEDEGRDPLLINAS